MRDGKRRSPLSPHPPCSASLARRGTRQSLDLYSHYSVKFILKECFCPFTIPTKECSGVGAPSHGQPPAKRPEGKSTEAISGKVLHHPVHLARNGFYSSFLDFNPKTLFLGDLRSLHLILQGAHSAFHKAKPSLTAE